jgi:peptidoglycan/LPS O-acetylase OafA/YrhL
MGSNRYLFPSPAGQTIIQGLNGHHNSLGFIRLTLATLVIVSHAYPLGGFGSDPLFRHFGAYDSIGGVAVVGFFGLSGFLVIRSAMGVDVVQFLWRRILRIFPAYWGALIFAAFVVGPFIWVTQGKGLSSYFTLGESGPFSYLYQNWDLSIGQYGIFDVFAETTPYGELVNGSVLNGSIWTLTYEWTLYLAVAALVLVGVLQKSKTVVVSLTLIFGLIQTLNLIDTSITERLFPFFADPFLISLGFVFFVGASMGIFGERIILDNKIGLSAGIISLLSLLEGGWTLFGSIAFPYFLLWLSFVLPRKLQQIGVKNDYSYGVYVYGFLVQQTTAHFGLHHLGAYVWMGLSIALTFSLAYLSWKIFESPAMKLKNRGPGRGISYWKSKHSFNTKSKDPQ